MPRIFLPRILILNHFRFVFLRHYCKTSKNNHSPSIQSTQLALMYCTINIKTRITIFEDLLALILIQVDLVCDFYLCYFALMQLANSRHFPNLCDNFWFNTIWHRRSLAKFVFCWKLAESDITVMPSVTYVD